MNLDYKNDKGTWHKYGVSKAGNILQAKAFAKNHRSDGVLSVVRFYTCTLNILQI